MEMTIEQYRQLIRENKSPKRKHYQRGKAAQKLGKLTEDAVDASLRNYAYQKLLVWKATGSKTRTYIDDQGRRQVQHIGHGPPDRSITLAPHGRSLMLEIKHFQNEVSTALIARPFQYDDLVDNEAMGGLGGYLIWWGRYRQWRYHPVSDCSTEGFGDGRKVRVSYKGSLAIPAHGFQLALLDKQVDPLAPLPEPDWLEVVIEN